MGDTGFEQARQYGDSDGSPVSAAGINAVGQEFSPDATNFDELNAAWQTLPDAVRRNLLAMVRQASCDS